MQLAVYTFHAVPGKESCGFLNQNELASFLTLSVLYSKQHFKKVKLVTNNYGKSILIDKFKIPFTEVSTELEGINFPKELWAYSKIKSYSLQTEAFISIDLDMILWQKPSAKQLKAPLLFQHKENFEVETGYYDLVNAINNTTVSYTCRASKVKHAFNCGVVGVNDLEMVKKWKGMIDDFIFNPANAQFWNSQSNKAQFNYLFEQYFIAVLTDKAEFLIGENEDVYKPKFKMTHLWGKTKQSPEIDRVKARFKKEYPRHYKRINAIELNETGVLDCILDKGPEKYTSLLKKTIKNKSIRSIVYLGFDDQHSKYLNMDGRSIDFLYSDATKNIMPECDLLIIKDMMLKWDGEQYMQFLSGKIPAKYIMDATGIHVKG